MIEKKRSGFGRAYGIFVIILLLLVAACLVTVWFLLKNYQESVQAENNSEWIDSQAAFEEYVEKMSYGDWSDLWLEANPESLDSRGDVLVKMEEILSDGVSYARAKSYTDETPVYVVENNEGSIAEFSLEKDDSGNWQVVSASMRLHGTESAQIEAPSGCKVYCNGIELDNTHSLETGSAFFLKNEYGDALVEPVSVLTWEITGQSGTPVLTAEAPAGCEIIDDKGLPVLSVDPNNYPEIKAAAEAFFHAFFKYGMYGYYDADINAAACARLGRKDSQAYNYIYTTLNAFHNAPCWSSYVFNNLTEAPMIKWAENAYSLDFEYDAEATYMGREKNYVSGKYRILVMDLGDGFQVCGIINQ